jgi:hypothetical protein
VLKEQGSWAWEQKPLLDEYVFALKAAQQAREGFDWLDSLEQYAENADDLPEIAWTVLRQIAGGLPTQWDRHSKRATALADTLILTPAARRRHGLGADDTPADPFAEFDELAARRGAA